MKIDINRFKLQYITADIDSAIEVLQGGCKWIQLRIKNNDIKTIKNVALEVKNICKSYGAVFIIDDYVDIVAEVGADGVHLGKLDMPINEARGILGDKIIGGTANSFEDVLTLKDKVDYIGLGPYKWTETKKNLSPIIGISGYSSIFNRIRLEKIEIPVVVIGGIGIQDVDCLIEIGANGVAVSGSIYNSLDRVGLVKDFLIKLNKI